MVRTKHLGEEDPDTLDSLNQLARHYGKNDQPQKSLLLYQKVVKIRTRTLGEGHMDTLSTIFLLALSYFSAGRLNDALTLLESTKERFRLNLGARDPYMVNVMSLLSCLYYQIGDREQDACRMAEQAVKLSREVWDDDHPRTLMYEAHLADILREVKEEQPGNNHPCTLGYEAELAEMLRGMNEEEPQTRIGTTRENKGWVQRLSRRFQRHLRLKPTRYPSPESRTSP